ncbi:alpha/beta hydrolase-fold protein [Nocardia sp. NPDC005978]|uniref:alpha/beta hydrolase-fold protein n=1 Tax=unclassified Nocardia TaxID=2637762 RepID=UPI0033B1B977
MTFTGLGPATAEPEAPAATGPATVQKVVWLGDRRVALWVNSPASGTPVQVQLLLARDWRSRPDAKFPVMFMLDGLRATNEENGWTKEAGAAGFFADKNVTVVLPIGGQSSFYTDWLQPDNGHNYKWETFLTKELPPLLESQWRATNARAVSGLSMGGTAAMMLAARNPGWVRHASSYSGFLTLTTLGMPQMVNFAMKDSGGFDSNAMFGPPSSPEWKAHDPYEIADQLKGVGLYISSGSGTAGASDPPSDIPGLTSNYAGVGLEVLSRLSSQNFVSKLHKLNIPVQVSYRPSGTHTWPYWDFEMRQSWSDIAASLGVDGTATDCKLGGAIAGAAQANNWLGDCLTPEYPVANGVAQDFRNGQVYFSPATGAQVVGGAISGTFAGLNGAGSGLGFPTGGEQVLPDGRGRFQGFQSGSIYWTPQTGAQMVRGAILDEWGRQGFEGGPAGYPNGPEQRTPNRDGVVQGFEHGPMYFSAKTGAHLLQGLILGRYAQIGFENSAFGFPMGAEQGLRDLGRYVAFEGGNIYWSPLSGAWGVRNGPIMQAWGAQGFENGPLGFPIGEEGVTAAGAQQAFQGGSILVQGDRAQVFSLDGRPVGGPVDTKPVVAKPDPAGPEALPGAGPARADQPAPATGPGPAAAPTTTEPPGLEAAEGFPLPIPALGPEVRPN